MTDEFADGRDEWRCVRAALEFQAASFLIGSVGLGFLALGLLRTPAEPPSARLPVEAQWMFLGPILAVVWLLALFAAGLLAAGLRGVLRGIGFGLLAASALLLWDGPGALAEAGVGPPELSDLVRYTAYRERLDRTRLGATLLVVALSEAARLTATGVALFVVGRRTGNAIVRVCGSLLASLPATLLVFGGCGNLMAHVSSTGREREDTFRMLLTVDLGMATAFAFAVGVVSLAAVGAVRGRLRAAETAG